MRERDYVEASLFLTRYFGSTTTHAVEIRALPNERGAGRAAPLFTRDPSDIETHCRRWDEIGRAVYFGTATRLLGRGSGKREDLAELPGLWADIDCLKLGLDKRLVAHTIGSDLYIKPSVIIDSGYGIHGHWLFRESLDIRLELDSAAELEADILAALRQLASVVAGDIAVCDLARVMRLPGTHNTKQGELAPCHVLEASWARHEYGEVLDWLDWQRPVLAAPRGAGGDRKKSARRPADGRPAESDAFARYAATAGIKPPIDVGARLAAMEYLGAGDASVHQTQLHVSASMVTHRAGDEAIVELLMAATREAVGLAGEHWNWAREEKNLRAMIGSARAKFGERVEAAAAEEPAAAEETTETEQEETEAEVINLAEQRRSRARSGQGGASKQPITARCGKAVIDRWADTYGMLRIIDADPYTYSLGRWQLWDKAEKHALRVQIQGILEAGQIDPKVALVGAICHYVMEHPDLQAEKIAWDSTGAIVCLDGVLMPGGGGWETAPHSPDHFATQRIEVRISDMGQGCPRWLAFLDSCFSDRTAKERAAIILCLQEWFGGAMVKRKPRELRKALWLYGASLTGKTRILHVLRLLIGEPRCALMLRGLGKQFGPSALLSKRAWIADDAVSAGDVIDDGLFKQMVTGEEFTADRKNTSHATGKLDIPMAFSSNVLPKVKDQSDGVYNRSMIIEMKVQRTEEETAGKLEIDKIVEAEELAGVFAWSLEGLARLRERGRFLASQSMTDANEDFKAANNPIAAWIKVALESAVGFMIDRRDAYASFKGWFNAEYGPSVTPPSPNSVTRGIKARLPVEDHKREGYPQMMGVMMTEDGLMFHGLCPRASYNDEIGSGTTVNRVCPEK